MCLRSIWEIILSTFKSKETDFYKLEIGLRDLPLFKVSWGMLELYPSKITNGFDIWVDSA